MLPEYDAYGGANRADPYPVLRQLREEAPVYWNGYEWVLSRYADVVTALGDARMSSARIVVTRPDEVPPPEIMRYQALLNAMMLFSDPPSHTRLRGLVAQAFSARRIENMRPRIQELVDDLVDAVVERGELDVIRDIADPLPGAVIAEMLGVPQADQPQFKAWARDFAMALDGVGVEELSPRRLGLRAINAMSEYLLEIFAARRSAPQDDLITALLVAEEDGQRLTHDEVIATCFLLLFAGNETTTNLIGNGLLTLLRQPDELRRLRDDPELIRTAVEELLRYESPVQLTDRRALEPLEIGGQQIESGQHVTVLLGAANRDPAQFPEPDRLDLGRRPNRHVAFIQGIHFCLGAPLARAEGQIAINTLVQRLPQLELVSDVPAWRELDVFRGLVTLPVAFAPA
jgi:cytochrome P450